LRQSRQAGGASVAQPGMIATVKTG